MHVGKYALLLLGLVATSPLAGQIYRWVGDGGVVHYSDQPPPPTTKKVQTVRPQANVVETDKETFAQRRAKALNPVQLFVSDCGLPCQQAQDFLRQRGIPYTQKDPQRVPEDAVELKKLVGALEVPVIQVGGNVHKGFESTAWGKLLDAAGYPLENPLPARGGAGPASSER